MFFQMWLSHKPPETSQKAQLKLVANALSEQGANRLRHDYESLFQFAAGEGGPLQGNPEVRRRELRREIEGENKPL